MRSLIRLAVVLVLLTASCRAEIAFVLDLDEEGSGSFGAELGFDEEMKNLLTAGGQEIDSDTIFQDFNLNDVPGASMREETRDDLTVYIAEAPFSDLTALRAEYIDDPDSPFRSFDLNVGEDEATLAATIAFPDATGELSSDELPFDPGTLTEDIFKIAFRVHMPGKVTSHNADRVLPDGTLEWTLPLTGGSVAAEATSSYGGGSFPIWLIALALVALAGVALVVMATVRNRRAPANAVAAAEAAAAQSAEYPAPASYVETSAGVALGEAPTSEPADPFASPPDSPSGGGPVSASDQVVRDAASTSDRSVRDAARTSDEAIGEAIAASDAAASEAIAASDAAAGEAIAASDAAASEERTTRAARDAAGDAADAADGDADEDVTGG